jgi:hypothetical protein
MPRIQFTLSATTANKDRKKFRKIESTFLRYGKVLGRNYERRAQRNEDKEIVILGYFHAHPYASIRNACRELDMNYSEIQRVLKVHKFHDYSLIPVQEIFPNDHLRRIEFCENMLLAGQEDPSFFQK